MQYKCEVCHDSGSKNQTGDYLDCPACDMPHTRKALNDFVKSLGPTHPEDVALAIHQRALAMVQKQDADHINDVVKIVAPAGWKLVPVEPTIEMIAALGWGGDEVLAVGHGAISGGIADEYAAMLAAAPAAPAAANGALTDEHIKEICESTGWIPEWNDHDHIKFARAIIAAAGPDAALIDEREAFEAKYGPKDAFAWRNADDTYKVYSLQMAWEIWQARAALSGAKGN